VFRYFFPRSSERKVLFAAGLTFILALLAGCAGYQSAPNNQPTPGALSVSATSFDFKNVVIGQTVNQTLTLSNTGQSALQLTTLTLSNKTFTITGPAVPRTILPANSLNYTITFAPTTAGNATATLKIATDASPTPASVNLAGNGEKAFANLVLTPASINFGNLTVKSTSTQNVTMQNTGDINMAIQGITVSGSGFGFSSLSPGFSLAPNQKVTFQVWFSPKTAGAAAATVSFLSPNLSSPETMALSGMGVAATGGGGNPPPTPHTVHLTWNASTSPVVGYRIYRSTSSSGSFTPLNGSAINGLSYNDTTVSSGTTYYYYVTAIDSSGNESVHSNQVTAAVPAS